MANGADVVDLLFIDTERGSKAAHLGIPRTTLLLLLLLCLFLILLYIKTNRLEEVEKANPAGKVPRGVVVGKRLPKRGKLALSAVSVLFERINYIETLLVGLIRDNKKGKEQRKDFIINHHIIISSSYHHIIIVSS